MTDEIVKADELTEPTTVHELLHHGDSAAEHVGAFIELCSRLADRFGIDRAVLIVRGSGADQLTAVSTWTNERVRRSLRINLPKHQSLLQKILESRLAYNDNFAPAFSGNSIERQLLLGDDATAFAVHPLRDDGEIVGLIGIAATDDSALVALDEDDLRDDLDRIAGAIRRYRDAQSKNGD